MRIACLCMVMALLVSGCTTTGKVEQMIDAQVAPQIEQINAQLDSQKTAAVATLEDMKAFVGRLGRTLDSDVKSLQAGVSGLKGQLSTLKTDAAGAQTDVNSVKAEVGKFDGFLNSLNDTVNSLKDDVKKLEAAKAAVVAPTAVAPAPAKKKGMFSR